MQQERKVHEVLTEMKALKERKAYREIVEYREYKELLVLGLHRLKAHKEHKERRALLFKVCKARLEHRVR